MNLRNTLIAALSVAAVTTVAYAFQTLSVKPNPENVVSAHILGTWKLDSVVTRKLDPQSALPATSTISFYDNPGVLPGLTAAAPRFANRLIFAAGIVNVDGVTHPYVLTNNEGNMYVVWFTAKGENTVAEVTTWRIHIALGKDKAKDMLFLGGETMRGADGAYERAADVPPPVTTPASAPAKGLEPKKGG